MFPNVAPITAIGVDFECTQFGFECVLRHFKMVGMAPPMSEEFTLAQWRSAVTSHFGKMDIRSAPGEAFSARMSAATLGEIALFDMITSPHTVRRTSESIGMDHEPFCKLSLQLEGSSAMTQDGRTCVLHPGDLALYVTQRPYELVYEQSQHTLVVYFPQRYLNFTPTQIEALTASPISRCSGLGRVAIPMFEQLATNIDVLDGEHAEALVRSALNMLISVFSSEYAAELESGTANLLFRQATAFIEQNLHDADLSPGMIAAALFVSVRHLHAQFATQGVTVAAYIRGRRLERVKNDLADPAHATESIHHISSQYGFHEPSHFSRVFKAEFGEAPRVFRARMLG